MTRKRPWLPAPPAGESSNAGEKKGVHRVRFRSPAFMNDCRAAGLHARHVYACARGVKFLFGTSLSSVILSRWKINWTSVIICNYNLWRLWFIIMIGLCSHRLPNWNFFGASHFLRSLVQKCKNDANIAWNCWGKIGFSIRVRSKVRKELICTRKYVARFLIIITIYISDLAHLLLVHLFEQNKNVRMYLFVSFEKPT